MPHIKTALRVLLPLVVIAIAALVTLVLFRSRPEVPTESRPVALPSVRVEAAVVQDLPMTVISQGTVSPRIESQLVPEIAGRVVWASPSFASGGFFEEGEALLRIDPYNYQQAVIAARSQVAQSRLRLAQEEAEADVARREWEDLGRGDASALTLREPQLEDVRASLRAAESNLQRAERDLERAEVTAPFAGRVRQKNVDVGQFVTVGSPVATLYAVDAAEVRLPLPDAELKYLDVPLAYRGQADRVGPRVTLRADFAGESHAWQGRIVRTEAEIDPVSRMVHVIAQVNDPYAPGIDPSRPPLAVGMFVEAEIEGRMAEGVVVLPRAALRGRDQVLVVDDEDRVRIRTVGVLRSTSREVVISEGLAPGERVILTPIEVVTEGMRVQIAAGTASARDRAAVPSPDGPPDEPADGGRS
ncbi:MAG: efflux RND transporter periplasmic adaptor subunit [Acidobacteria bacterium]|nr:efflux RND transporter periplasmic adaptor subunit [Acidobacteriota bacterium]